MLYIKFTRKEHTLRFAVLLKVKSEVLRFDFDFIMQIRLPRRRQLPPIKGGQELLRIIMNYYEFIRILRGVSKELQTSEDFLGLPRTSEHVLGLA